VELKVYALMYLQQKNALEFYRTVFKGFRTQGEIAKLLDISQKAYSNFETGKRKLRLQHLIALKSDGFKDEWLADDYKFESLKPQSETRLDKCEKLIKETLKKVTDHDEKFDRLLKMEDQLRELLKLAKNHNQERVDEDGPGDRQSGLARKDLHMQGITKK